MDNTPTWRDYARWLTPDQVEEFARCDNNPTHPDGPDAHRRGQIRVAQLYLSQRPWWRKLLAETGLR